jgi:hypothetical protein
MAINLIDVTDSKIISSPPATFVASYPLRDGTYDVGNYHLDSMNNIGPVSFQTIDGFKCSGPSYGIGGIEGVGNLLTTMSSKHSWSVEAYVYPISLSSIGCWFGYTLAGLSENTLAIMTDGSVAISHGQPPSPGGCYIQTDPGLISPGIWTKIEYRVITDGGNSIGHVFVNDVEKAVGEPFGYAQLFSVSSMTVGYQILFGYNFNGYIRNLKIKTPQLSALP